MSLASSTVADIPRHGYSVAYITHRCRCDECRRWNREHTKKYLTRNRERINAQRRSRWATSYSDKASLQLRRKRAILARYKMLTGCTRCGYREHAVALQFHHLDPSQKSFEIGASLTRSWAKVKDEVRKCRVLCANCHVVVEAGGDPL